MSKSISNEEFEDILRYFRILPSYSRNIEYRKFEAMKSILQLFTIRFMGLRPNEARLIKICNIDFNKKMLYLPAMYSKTRIDDYIPIPDFIYNALWVYLQARCKFFRGSAFLFPARCKGGVDNKDKLYWQFRRAMKKAGVGHNISYIDKKGNARRVKSLYGLRKSFITQVYQKTDMNIRKAAIAARHHDIEMRSTLRYIDEIEDDARRDIFREVYAPKKLETSESENSEQIILNRKI